MRTAVPKLSFATGGDFLADTRREVELYLRSRRTRVSGRIRLYAKTFVALALMFACLLYHLTLPTTPYV
jgi:hypothetical protein